MVLSHLLFCCDLQKNQIKYKKKGCGGSIFNSLPIRGLADVSIFFFFFFSSWAHICGTSRISILLFMLHVVYYLDNFYSVQSKQYNITTPDTEYYLGIAQNNESSCLTLVALMHCVLRATSLSLDPPTEAAFPVQSPIAAVICIWDRLQFLQLERNTHRLT